jgi:hypothetical protein
LAISTHVHQIHFEKFISTNGIFLNIHYTPSQCFFYLEEIVSENFNIFENNIISVELAKALKYDKLVLNLSFVTLGMWIILECPNTKKDFLKSAPVIKCLNQQISTLFKHGQR